MALPPSLVVTEENIHALVVWYDALQLLVTRLERLQGGAGGERQNEIIGITNMGLRGGEALGFAIPTRYLKDFIRNREAFAYDRNNPNSGHNYLKPPTRSNFEAPPVLKDASGSAPISKS